MTVEEMKSQIDKDVKSNKIVLYMKGNKQMPQCGFSARVVEILNNHKAEFETRDVLADNDLRQAIKEYSQWPTLPQLYIGGQFIGGCDIVTEMDQNGDLKSVLAG